MAHFVPCKSRIASQDLKLSVFCQCKKTHSCSVGNCFAISSSAYVWIINYFPFQHQFVERERPILNEDMMINMTAVFEAEKQMPPEAKRNSGRKNDFGKSNNFLSLAHFLQIK
jgi:hypothetical protein